MLNVCFEYFRCRAWQWQNIFPSILSYTVLYTFFLTRSFYNSIGDVLYVCSFQFTSFQLMLLFVYTQEKNVSTIITDIFSSVISIALLSGILIPTFQSTNSMWLAAARSDRLHIRIKAELHENCGTNRNRPSALSCTQKVAGWGSCTGRLKFRQLSVMQACYLKASKMQSYKDRYYGCHFLGDRLSVGWPTRFWEHTSSHL